MRQNIWNISPVCKYLTYFFSAQIFLVEFLLAVSLCSLEIFLANWDPWTLCILFTSQTLEQESKAVALGNLVSYLGWLWIWHKLIGGCRLKLSLYFGQNFFCRYFSQTFGHFWSHFVKGQVQLWASRWKPCLHCCSWGTVIPAEWLHHVTLRPILCPFHTLAPPNHSQASYSRNKPGHLTGHDTWVGLRCLQHCQAGR